MIARLGQSLFFMLAFSSVLAMLLEWRDLSLNAWATKTLLVFGVVACFGFTLVIIGTAVRCFAAARLTYLTGRRSGPTNTAQACCNSIAVRKKEASNCFAGIVAGSLTTERDKFVLVQRGGEWKLRLRTPPGGGVYSEVCRNIEDREVVEVARRFAEEHLETLLVIDSELGAIEYSQDNNP